jgi:uncharacterized protein YbjT (DUF2867 family)
MKPIINLNFKNMILVIGSTGMLGNEVCRLLITKNYKVRAMVRTGCDKQKLNKLESLGVQLVYGDLRDKSSFQTVLKDVEAVITTVSSMPFSYQSGENDIQKVDDEGMINLVKEAKNSGVKHFIYTSISKNMDLDFPLRNAKRKVEKHLMQSGLNYTILRPGCFMEVWLSAAVGFDALNGRVNLFGTGSNPLAYISIKDVAKFAVESVSNPAAINAELELGGPEHLSQLDAVKIFEEVLKRKIEVQSIPVEALHSQLNEATDGMQKSFSGLMLCVANGDYIDMKDILKTFKVNLTSVRAYIGSLVESSRTVA